MEATRPVLTNKYAEGYPGKRYYGGCEYVDQVEQLAIDRLKAPVWRRIRQCAAAFRLRANQAVYVSVLAGRHHPGHEPGAWRPPDPRRPVNISGKLYNVVAYGLNEAEAIDYDEAARLAREHKPKMIVAGASVYALEIDWARFRAIADEVGAYLFVDMAPLRRPGGRR